jgi:hypothetical protein
MSGVGQCWQATLRNFDETLAWSWQKSFRRLRQQSDKCSSSDKTAEITTDVINNLTKSDFFLWVCLKEEVYSKNPRSLDELKHNIEQTFAKIVLTLISPKFTNTVAFSGEF